MSSKELGENARESLAGTFRESPKDVSSYWVRLGATDVLTVEAITARW